MGKRIASEDRKMMKWAIAIINKYHNGDLIISGHKPTADEVIKLVGDSLSALIDTQSTMTERDEYV